MNSKYNLCDEIRCPWSAKSGCDRYTVSNHCHLLGEFDRGRRSYIDANQYWLFAKVSDSAIDINELRAENIAFLKRDENTKRAIAFAKDGLGKFPRE